MPRKTIGLVLLLIISAVGVAVPIVSANDSGPTPIDGADNRENAPVLQKGEEYHPTGGWYKVYVDEPGARVHANFSDVEIDTDESYENGNYQINNRGTELKLDSGGYGYDYYKSPDYEYISKTSGYTYIYLPPDGSLDGDPYTVLTVTAESPATEVYDVESVSAIPQDIKPGEETTLQARVRYDQSGLINSENGDVEILVDGEVLHTEQISPGQGNAVSVSTTYNISSTGETGDRTITARAAPNWTSVSQGTQAQTTLSVDATDLDNDGLYDSREEELGTDPRDADSDDDGLDDGREIKLGIDSIEEDTDGDGLIDNEEVNGDTDPLTSDTDGDGLPDGEEVSLGSDPTLVDTDDDRLTDPKEVELGTDPASADTDDDGLSDQRELEEGTDPTNVDTDSDGLPDAKEIELGTDPESTDTDSDNLSDYEEYQQGTDPLSETESSGETGTNESEVVADRSLVVKSDSVNLQLRSQKTIVNPDEPAVLTFSSTALISANDTVHVQLVLEAPSGVSVGGTDFVESGLGQYTTTYELEPGNSRGIQIEINANELGRFGVTGRAVYYVGNDKENASTRTVSIPVQVVGEDPNSQSEDNSVTDSTGVQTGSTTDSEPGSDGTQTTIEGKESSGANSGAGIVGSVSDFSTTEIAAVVIILLLSLLLLIQFRR